MNLLMMSNLERDIREIFDTKKRIGFSCFNRDESNNITIQSVIRGYHIKIQSNYCNGFKIYLKDTNIEIIEADNYELIKLKNEMYEIVNKKNKNRPLIFFSIWGDDE